MNNIICHKNPQSDYKTACYLLIGKRKFNINIRHKDNI